MSDINITFNFYDDSDANFYMDGSEESDMSENYIELTDDEYYYESENGDEEEMIEYEEEDDYEYVYDDYSEEWVFWDDL